MKPALRKALGFTLIELLVVVAIIALLIAILLPSLQRAREQARVAVCMANLRTISQAANSYLLEQIDLPWTLGWKYFVEGNVYDGMNCYSEFIWGGAMPGTTPGEFKNAANQFGGKLGNVAKCDIYIVPPRYRPLNPYMANSVSWDREPKERLKRPADVPGFFKCPSDNNIAVPYASSDNNDIEDNTAWSTWQFWGTSFAISWYWPYYYQQTKLYNKAPYNNDFSTILGTDHIGTAGAGNVVPGLGANMLNRSTGRFASQLIIFYENRMNYAMEGAEPRGKTSKDAKNLRGWHKQADYHTAAFRDGSARYQRYDTRYVDGIGWSTWPSKPWEGNLAQFNEK